MASFPKFNLIPAAAADVYCSLIATDAHELAPILHASLMQLISAERHENLKDTAVYGSAKLFLLSSHAHNVVVTKIANLIEIFYFKKQGILLEDLFKSGDFSVPENTRCLLISCNSSELCAADWQAIKVKEYSVLKSFSTYSSMLAQIYLNDESKVSTVSNTYSFETLEATCGSLELLEVLTILTSRAVHGKVLSGVLSLSKLSALNQPPKEISKLATAFEALFETVSLLTPGPQKQLSFKSFSVWLDSTSNSLILSQENRKYKIQRISTTQETVFEVHLCSKKFAGAETPSTVKTVSALKYYSLVLSLSSSNLYYSGGYLSEIQDITERCLLNLS